VAGNAVGQRRKLRRGAELPADDSRRRCAAGEFDNVAGDIDRGNWLPASMTPTVSTKAVRARSIATGGALLRSKPMMKSAIASEAVLAPCAPSVVPAVPACCR